MIVIPLPQGSEEGGDVGLDDLTEPFPTGCSEPADPPREVPAVGQQGVRGQPALDRQVVEVDLDRPDGDRLDGSEDGQASTSDRCATGSPCASPTGA